GAAFMFDLRLLGLARAIPVSALADHLLRWARLALVLVVPSGTLMFVAHATEMSSNPAFRVKLVLIAAALVNAGLFHRWPFIAAATIEARNHGLRVLGCYDGFKWLVQGDTEHVVDLEINDTSRIHFDGGSIIRTSRTNPTKAPEGVAHVAEALKRLGVDHLL